MKILVTGATGFIGRHLIRALHEAGHKVTGSARGTLDASPLGMRYGWMPSDFSVDTHVDDWLPRLHNKAFDVVINAVGILREQGSQTFAALHNEAPQALFKVAQQCGVKQLIQISALGEGDSIYYTTKRAADDYVLSLETRATVLRPSVIYGESGDSTRLFRMMASMPLIPLVGRGDQMIQPVHVNELCKVITALIKQPAEQNTIVEVVGPEPVRMKDFLVMLRRGIGKGKAHFIPMPMPLVKLGARMGDYFNLPGLSCQSLRMLLDGNTGNPADTIRLLGKRPYRVSEYFS